MFGEQTVFVVYLTHYICVLPTHFKEIISTCSG